MWIVYYDIFKSKFRTIRGFKDDEFIVSLPTNYYNDAISINQEELKKEEYLNNLYEIKDIESFIFSKREEIKIKNNIIKIDYKALSYNKLDFEKWNIFNIIKDKDLSFMEILLKEKISLEKYEEADIIHKEILKYKKC